MLNISELERKTITELHTIAKKMELSGYSQMRKKDLIFAILKKEQKTEVIFLPKEYWKSLKLKVMDF